MAAAAASAECAATKDVATRITPLLKGQVAAMVAAERTAQVVDRVLQGPDGKPMTLDHFAGKTVLSISGRRGACRAAKRCRR
jgi:hypothetical protein